MADKIYKIAPRVAITTKGVILDSGTEVTAKEFTNEKVFENLIKNKKIVSAEDYIKIRDELENPKKDSKKDESKKDDENKAGTVEQVSNEFARACPQ